MSKSDDAIQFIKNNKRELIKKFADPEIYLTVQNPAAFFMAGSPGAGKTEYSKAFIKELCARDDTRRIVRIDADEVRDYLPQYDKTNASEMQRAAILGVNKILDYVFDKDIDFLLDSTFSKYDYAKKDIEICIKHKRKIAIIYIYQDPLVAWDFTKKREKLEGRPIPKDFFIKSFFEAIDTVNKINKEFRQVQVTILKRNIQQGIEKADINVDNVDKYLNLGYTADSLNSRLG
ncbi:MAG: zeta toxin family protein [bacterium]|nr:zeta toxin family protein [bacterium]